MTRTKQHDKISTLTLTMIIYFGVCGGPIGSEPLIGTLGPLIGLVSIVVYPISNIMLFERDKAQITIKFSELPAQIYKYYKTYN